MDGGLTKMCDAHTSFRQLAKTDQKPSDFIPDNLLYLTLILIAFFCPFSINLFLKILILNLILKSEFPVEKLEKSKFLVTLILSRKIYFHL